MTDQRSAAPCQECGALLDESCGIYLGGSCADPRRSAATERERRYDERIRSILPGGLPAVRLRAVGLADLEYVLAWLRQFEAPENIIGLQERGLDIIVGREVDPGA